jgi:hypothetical protein
MAGMDFLSAPVPKLSQLKRVRRGCEVLTLRGVEAGRGRLKALRSTMASEDYFSMK